MAVGFRQVCQGVAKNFAGPLRCKLFLFGGEGLFETS